MKRDLEIQLLTGRMKGQAFLTFPTIDIAKHALMESNGYLLRDKPMIVEFSRSGHTTDIIRTEEPMEKDTPPPPLPDDLPATPTEIFE